MTTEKKKGHWLVCWVNVGDEILPSSVGGYD